MTEDAFWTLERRLWLEGIEAYKAHLHEAAVFVFPQIGALTYADILSALENAPRWEHADFSRMQFSQPSDEVVCLAYRAVGTRAEGEPYTCFCSSTYVKAGEDWRIIQHQQTPDT